MNDKVSIILDTNFLISYKADLLNIHKKLSESYNVFVSEVSIQERVSQKYLELKDKYNNIEKFKNDNLNFVEIKYHHSFEDIYEIYKNKIQNNYKDLFGNNIIQFNENDYSLNLVMERVYKKLPSFNNLENASDKGFKDTLIWLSILNYFKKSGGNNSIFITNDNFFLKYTDALCNEFYTITGKNIEIKENNFFEIPITKPEEIKSEKIKLLMDFSVLRSKIQEYIYGLCSEFDGYDYWDKPKFHDLFKLKKIVTEDDMRNIFQNLKIIIENNLFETAINADVVFGTDFESNYPIPIDALQNALNLYIDIHNEYKEYLPQFFYTASNIFNKNYDGSILSNFECPF
jgi:hypothetical protein